ncbi:DUF5686 family protein [Pseudoflavitalea rhizosphaerae]|uniref:DUF5686 family protein n=1 Tax=Pseudoflavitalea rhizosphaerae TaxID=1884793 RepID=UPI001F49D690|nr:DUF5686 family protein [Pseudoflavitalea rhizosphaerae]
MRGCISLIVLLLCLQGISQAQTKILRGIIKDAHSDERVPFASMQFLKRGNGGVSDSSGAFIFRFDQWPADTIKVTYVGFQDFFLVIDSALVSKEKNGVLDLTIMLERGKFVEEVVVRQKIDRGYLMWKRIVKHKPKNDRYRFQNFSYELYNKLEIDLKNIKKDKFGKLPFVKQFKFVLNNIDTTEEGNTFLPVYLTEAISDYYYQKSPKKRREVFKGIKTIGVNNESVGKLLGGMDQNINFYSNFIPVFDKQFVSPISDNGDNYYRFRVLDTQYVNNQRLIHVTFTPKRKGENTFEGDCWVHDPTWAIQKMNLRLTKDANINFVDKLSLIQEFKLINDSTWFLSRDKFVVDMSLTGDKHLSAIGRKSTTYENVIVNDSSVLNELAKNSILEETVMPPEAMKVPDSFWVEARHEDLSKHEQALYKTIDTLLSLPAFRRVAKTVNFLVTGYRNIGNYEIGPWYNWITYNQQEGFRTRFDLGTNKYFNKNLFLHGYLAYGFKDQEFKYQFDGRWFFDKSPRTYVSWMVRHDFDRGQQYYDEISQDNIFALAIRKSGVPIKFLMMDERKLEFFRDSKIGLSVTVSGSHKEFDPVANLPYKSMFAASVKDSSLKTAEFSIRLRYAYLEKFLESTFNRYSLGSDFPIVEFRYTRGVSGVFNSRFDYHKLNASVSDYAKIPPFGTLYYNVFAGRTYGKLPYMMLDVAPGNEIYYYNKYAFNLMNRYEYLHDRYAGVNVEHNIGPGLFRFLPLTRKFKFRQFWSAKALWGGLSDENKAYNMPVGSPYIFELLDGKPYVEIGTGVDNIFKLFRLDFLWRVSPTPLPKENVKKFGVFFSFKLSF